MEGFAPGLTRYHLDRFHPLRYLNHDWQDQLLSKSVLVHYDKGDVLFNNTGEGMQTYYLLSGRVELRDSFFSRNRITSSDLNAQYPLDESAPRGATAIAKSAVSALVLNREYVDYLLVCSEATRQPAQHSMRLAAHLEHQAIDDQENWIWRLLNTPLFSGLPHSNLEQLFSELVSVPVKAGQQIIQQGDDSDDFYIIKRGRARIDTPEDDEQDTLIRSAGDYFGEETLVSDNAPSTTVSMLTDGELAKLNSRQSRELLQEAIIKVIDPYQAEKIRQHRDCEYLDVRMQAEYDHKHRQGYRNIPLNKLRSALPGLCSSNVYIVSDEGGRRSELAALWLKQAGFEAYLLGY